MVSGSPVLDHVALLVSDMEASRRFYLAALAPLGFRLLYENDTCAAFGTQGHDDFAICLEQPPTTRAHIAFTSPDRSATCCTTSTLTGSTPCTRATAAAGRRRHPGPAPADQAARSVASARPRSAVLDLEPGQAGRVPGRRGRGVVPGERALKQREERGGELDLGGVVRRARLRQDHPRAGPSPRRGPGYAPRAAQPRSWRTQVLPSGSAKSANEP